MSRAIDPSGGTRRTDPPDQFGGAPEVTARWPRIPHRRVRPRCRVGARDPRWGRGGPCGGGGGVRHDLRSVFTRETLHNHTAFIATAAVIALLVAIVEMDALHGLFTTTDLTSGQWLACAAVGSAILWTGELVKAILRARARRRPLGRETPRHPHRSSRTAA